MKHTENDIVWYDSLKDAKDEGYFPVKVTSLLQFYTLRGKTPPLIKEKINKYAQDIINESKRLGRDKPISLATATLAARERLGLPESDNSTNLSASNLEPIRYLHYLVQSPTDNGFYFKMFRHYPLNDLYFNRRSLTYSGEDEALSSLRRYVFDEHVTLLFSRDQVDNINTMMARVYHGNVSWQGEFKRNDFYKLFFRILDRQLQYDDYLDYGKNLTGFKTTCNLMKEQIQELWKEAYELRIESPATA